ncbi:hypothetical protein BO78DRAFT_431894 [Aspergillus sclerotiicarbonarius CBS 121057]|uniref:Uncharacterized protein n=1 Tax=Aspergillus sclerotiicarbonarius (strain CBS 121057 / IBT 28362) TaxID=1448318 RepID=A0A319E0T1_ASPSB|nr:hypothetical protein BO78DRAFT_431894 [Aspergillus sclerotiicarbonarius CBS 121057]
MEKPVEPIRAPLGWTTVDEPVNNYFKPSSFPWFMAKSHGLTNPQAIATSVIGMEPKFLFSAGEPGRFYLGHVPTWYVYEIIEPGTLEEIYRKMNESQERNLTMEKVELLDITWEEMVEGLPEGAEECDLESAKMLWDLRRKEPN